MICLMRMVTHLTPTYSRSDVIHVYITMYLGSRIVMLRQIHQIAFIEICSQSYEAVFNVQGSISTG